jgi:hypothetical protein
MPTTTATIRQRLWGGPGRGAHRVVGVQRTRIRLMLSGSPAPRITLVASSTVLNSLRGMPITSQITSGGNGCEIRSAYR